MNKNPMKRPPDPFGDDEGVLDITCRPAGNDDLPQVAFLAVGLLDRLFGDSFAQGSQGAVDITLANLRTRLRLDSTWVMSEGETIIGMIDLETSETRKLNGLPIPRVLSDSLGITEMVTEAGLLPLLVHEPAPDEAHQSLVALLPGSRGEGRGTLLLMHGAFWARAQGKNWMTCWLPDDDPGRAIYSKRGYTVMDELDAKSPSGSQKWVFLKKPISSHAHKILRQESSKGDK